MVVKPKYAKAKGSKKEIECKEILAQFGYVCTKAGGSLGLFDVVGERFNPNGVEGIALQSKKKGGGTKQEKEAFVAFDRLASSTLKVWAEYLEGGFWWWTLYYRRPDGGWFPVSVVEFKKWGKKIVLRSQRGLNPGPAWSDLTAEHPSVHILELRRVHSPNKV